MAISISSITCVVLVLVMFNLSSLVSAVGRPSTMVLERNGYKNMVIAIHDSVQEDPIVINGIKDALTKASKHLYVATRERAFFQEITILVPNSWGPNLANGQAMSETIALADVIITNTTSRSRRALPQIRSYDGCGQQGVHILLTEEFATTPRAAPYFTFPDKYFVHAFAQFRWGVFQEYAEVGETEYYISLTSGHPEAIRCVYYLRGLIQKDDANQTICYTDIDPSTGLYYPECLWRPYPRSQRIKASYMDHHYINEIVTFCDDSSDFMLSHNYEAPSKHNRLCDHRSTWDIISNTEDFRNGHNLPRSGLTDQQLTPIFNVVRAPARRKRALIVMDRSTADSSSAGDITLSVSRLKHELTKHAVDISTTHIQRPFIRNLGSEVPGDSHVVLLGHGKPSGDISAVQAHVPSSTIVVMEPDLTYQDQTTNADVSYITNVSKNNLLDHLRHEVTTNIGINDDLVTVFSEKISVPSNGVEGSVMIDASLRNAVYFRFYYTSGEPVVKLWSSSGTRISMDDVSCRSYHNLKLVEFTITNQIEVGEWYYSIKPIGNTVEDVTVTVTSLPDVNHEDHMHVKASVRSHLTPHNYLALHVDVICHLDPVVGLDVTARVIAPDGSVSYVRLLDNGAGADIAKHDGVYSRYYANLTIPGVYHVAFVIKGDHTTFYIKEDSINLSSDENGDANSLITTTHRRIARSSFGRHVTGTSVLHSAVSDVKDVIPPSRILDLKVLKYLPYRRSFALQWTAPGDDMDSGKVSKYRIWIGRDIKDIRHLKDLATSGTLSTSGTVPTSDHMTKKLRQARVNAGETEVLILPVTRRARTFVFGIQAIDESGNVANVSNIATASVTYS